MHPKRWWPASLLLVCLACESAPRKAHETEHYGFISDDSDYVWARGPWSGVEPSRDVDDVIDRLCPAIMKLPGATDRDYGQEYCGLIYSRGDGIYRVSHPSPLGRWQLRREATKKSCFPVRKVIDPEARSLSILADYHSHPWHPSPLSEPDRRAANQLWLIKIQFDSACHIQKLIPHLDDVDRPGEVYSRRGKQWVRIGLIKPADKPFGFITPVGRED
ncbi:hypothetical protein MXAN_6973 [Myxococcus xanthus DK 1622]|uniref:JAB domain-containing protein n=1 Tax=Myxococcus xanthus (strain DK1622) TaxID=246197 RepID=Q1CWY5_MYXXD|nr:MULTISPECIES: Mov34/MPN/PAD-1 family protein [Myxococcus]ABF91236.1 hypothetical protein MXAN_6973 [Myxococcus xanthus DK 1622]NOJ56217.1 hypothetical protein [Myxococcus xanthus]QPM79255.1 Mov34/MPN/PAD-1 family protein [Myxococcus xanthus]QVW68333.1 Mov34/MPN/PAD-1 family protein [Myxococcus xanthus DZ2]QZZ54577.1 hypothetical protein MyxoNM_35630 [Myxococcus xanthus]